MSEGLLGHVCVSIGKSAWPWLRNCSSMFFVMFPILPGLCRLSAMCSSAVMWPLHTAHCTLHTAHCILHTAYYIMHTAQCTLHNSHWILHTTHLTLHTEYWTLNIANCKLQIHTTHYTLHTAHSFTSFSSLWQPATGRSCRVSRGVTLPPRPFVSGSESCRSSPASCLLPDLCPYRVKLDRIIVHSSLNCCVPFNVMCTVHSQCTSVCTVQLPVYCTVHCTVTYGYRVSNSRECLEAKASFYLTPRSAVKCLTPQSALHTAHSTLPNSTLNTQHLTPNNQQSTINIHQSTINIQHFSVNTQNSRWHNI